MISKDGIQKYFIRHIKLFTDDNSFMKEEQSRSKVVVFMKRNSISSWL